MSENYDNDRREEPELPDDLEAEAEIMERQFTDEWVGAPLEATDGNSREASATGGEEADADNFVSPFKQVPASDDYTAEEEAFHSLYEEVLWREDAAGRDLFAGTRMPDNVRARLTEAIRDGALFPEFDAMNDQTRAEFREYLLNQAQGGGWSIRELAMRLRRIDPTLTQFEAERIARTETQAIVTTARELWYADEGDFVGDETLFIWQGPQDGRTTEACAWLKGGNSLAGDGPPFEGTNPQYGGTPRTLEDMRELVRRAAEAFFPDLESRRWTVNPFERHTIVRYYAVGA